MNHFFAKKEFFGTVFLIFILSFSIVNLIHSAESWQQLGTDMKDIEDVSSLQTWLKEVDTTTTDSIWGKMLFIESYGGVQKALGKNEFNNFAYIKDAGGMLYYGALSDLPMRDLEEYAGNVRRMQEVVETNGAKLIVVIPPSKVLAGVSEVNLEWPINDPNARTDKFLNLMMQNGIFAVDMRLPAQKSGEKLDDLFLKTDHHWTPLNAWYASCELVDKVEEKFGDNWDPDNYYRDMNNYHSAFYSQCMLGSTGRNTGIVYAGLDDFLLLWPECDMEFTWYNYEDDKVQTGNYREALFDLSVLEGKDIYTDSYYRIYLGEVITHDKIVNHSNPDGPKLTVLRDSYFSPMACFLAPMCSEIEMMWGRTKHNDADFEEYIRESDADYVILECYPYNLDQDSFDFFKEAE